MICRYVDLHNRENLKENVEHTIIAPSIEKMGWNLHPFNGVFCLNSEKHKNGMVSSLNGALDAPSIDLKKGS